MSFLVPSHIHDASSLLNKCIVVLAALWIAYRTWTTLFKPLPELINILGVQIPDPPEVSLVAIKSDYIELRWARYSINKPVRNYKVTVNGIAVVEPSGEQSTLTVKGLKPGHFYNIQVTAIGLNNYETQSHVLRVRTCGKDGRPELGNGRASALNDNTQSLSESESDDDTNAALRIHAGPADSNITADSALSTARELGVATTNHRKNIAGRQHTPSNASDHPPSSLANDTNESMTQLTERFETVRTDTDAIIALTAKERDESDTQIADLIKERDERKSTLRDREEASERLKREVNTADRANRTAQNRKATKEKALREKEAERQKLRDELAKWAQERENMQEQQRQWQTERKLIKEDTQRKSREMRDLIEKLRRDMECHEEVLREKGLQCKELEEKHNHLQSSNEPDDETRERAQLEQQKDREDIEIERELVTTYSNLITERMSLNARLLEQQHVRAIPVVQPQYGFAVASEVEQTPSHILGIRARRGQEDQSLINTQLLPHTETEFSDSPLPGFQNGAQLVLPPFGLYNDVGVNMADGSEGAPLSPSATQLLPTDLFMDDSTDLNIHDRVREDPHLLDYGSGLYQADDDSGADDETTHSARLSQQSGSIATPEVEQDEMPSRASQSADEHNSTKSPRAQFGVIGESGSLVPIPEVSKRKHFSFRRLKDSSDTTAVVEEAQPSQGGFFSEANPRNRGSSFTFSMFGRQGEARSGRSTRKDVLHKSIGMVAGDSPSNSNDPSSPRPASIASMEFPRPSIEHNPFGWSVDPSATNSSPRANWSMSPREMPSRVPPGFENAPPQSAFDSWGSSYSASRRPSIQHASSSAMSGNLSTFSDTTNHMASSRDDPTTFEELHQFGDAIDNARPESSRSAKNFLNPNAPAFSFQSIFSRSNKNKTPLGNVEVENGQQSQTRPTSPTMSRKSKDAQSILSATSRAESMDYLEHSESAELPTSQPGSVQKEKSRSFVTTLARRFSSNGLRSQPKSKAATPISERASSDMQEQDEEELLINNLMSEASAGVGSGSSTTTPTVTPKKGMWPKFSMTKGKNKDKERERKETSSISEMGLTSGTETTEDEKE